MQFTIKLVVILDGAGLLSKLWEGTGCLGAHEVFREGAEDLRPGRARSPGKMAGRRDSDRPAGVVSQGHWVLARATAG